MQLIKLTWKKLSISDAGGSAKKACPLTNGRVALSLQFEIIGH